MMRKYPTLGAAFKKNPTMPQHVVESAQSDQQHEVDMQTNMFEC